jgi:hypothetical protein
MNIRLVGFILFAESIRNVRRSKKSRQYFRLQTLAALTEDRRVGQQRTWHPPTLALVKTSYIDVRTLTYACGRKEETKCVSSLEILVTMGQMVPSVSRGTEAPAQLFHHNED